MLTIEGCYYTRVYTSFFLLLLPLLLSQLESLLVKRVIVALSEPVAHNYLLLAGVVNSSVVQDPIDFQQIRKQSSRTSQSNL